MAYKFNKKVLDRLDHQFAICDQLLNKLDEIFLRLQHGKL